MNKKNLKEDLSLPQLPSLSGNFNSPLDYPKSSLNNLPSFPSSSFGDKIALDAIKNSVSQGELNYPEDYEQIEEEKLPELQLQKPRTESHIPSPKIPQLKQSSRQIFVKIENFKKAIEAFEEIKLKVAEIEGLIAEVKDVKKREEFELEEWARELQLTKDKLEILEKNLFSKVE